MAELSPKQQMFVEEYMIDLNAKQSAIRAGYSPRSAEQQGSRLLSNAKVRAHIDRAMAERSKRTGISQDRVLRELARLAFIDPNKVINMSEATLRSEVCEDDTAAIASVKVKKIPTKEGTGVEREIKLYDKGKALEMLGKHLGMFTDKVELKADMNVNNPMTNLSTEELRRLANLVDDQDE